MDKKQITQFSCDIPSQIALINLKGKSVESNCFVLRNSGVGRFAVLSSSATKIEWKLKIEVNGVFYKGKPWNLDFIQESYKWNG